MGTPPLAPTNRVPAVTDPLAGRDMVTRRANGRSTFGDLFTFRRPVSPWAAALLGALCLALVFGLWWFLTRGPHEERIIAYGSLPSPAETYNREQFDDLWFGNALTRNLFVSLRRVVSGFALAVVVAIPLSVLCGCFPCINAFFAPVNVFGRNVSIAALIPLTFALFGIGETQKVLFMFISVVSGIMMDT